MATLLPRERRDGKGAGEIGKSRGKSGGKDRKGERLNGKGRAREKIERVVKMERG